MSNSFVTLRTIAHQVPLSMGQKYCRGLPFPSPEDLPNPGGKPTFPALIGGFFTTEPPGKPGLIRISVQNQKSSYDLSTQKYVEMHEYTFLE